MTLDQASYIICRARCRMKYDTSCSYTKNFREAPENGVDDRGFVHLLL